MQLAEMFFAVSDIKRDDFWEGTALTASQWASGVYLVVTIAGLVVYALCGHTNLSDLPDHGKLLAIAVGFVVSAGPPAWFWFEARAFDRWINTKFPSDRKLQERHRETFRINAEYAKAFWAAIVAVYAAVLLKW